MLCVIDQVIPHKNAALLAVKAVGGITGIFQCPPGFLEEQPLLGVHQLRFLGRHIEKERIEFVDVR